MKNKAFIRFIVLFIGLAFLLSKPAYAYLDPGSGSYILQIIVAASVASIFAIKTFFGQIKAFFGARFSKKKPNSEDEKTK